MTSTFETLQQYIYSPNYAAFNQVFMNNDIGSNDVKNLLEHALTKYGQTIVNLTSLKKIINDLHTVCSECKTDQLNTIKTYIRLFMNKYNIDNSDMYTALLTKNEQNKFGNIRRKRSIRKRTVSDRPLVGADRRSDRRDAKSRTCS